MSAGGRALLLALPLLLAACATPQIQTESKNLAIQVKVKTPAVAGLAFSRDGKTLVVGAADETTRIWDLANVRQARRVKGDASMVTDVVFSPDGKTLAAASLGGMTRFSSPVTTFLDVATGKETGRCVGVFGKISYTPDGRYLLGEDGAAFGARVKLCDVSTGQVVREFPGFQGILSPDGRTVLIRRGRGLDLVDAADGRQIWSVANAADRAFVFSPDGKRILVGVNKRAGNGPAADLDTSLVLLDASSGARLKEFGQTHIPVAMFSVQFVYQLIGAVAFSPDGRFAISGTLGGEYTLWDLDAGAMVRKLGTGNAAAEMKGTMLNVAASIAISPDGRTAAVTSLAAVRLYSLSTGAELATLVTFEDGEWLFTTPGGYYNASEKGDQYLDISLEGKPYAISQFREAFFRPDLIKVALLGGSLQDQRKISEVKQPPEVAIVDTPGSTSADEITVTLQLKEQGGGGIGDVRLYRNDTAVVQEQVRNLQVAAPADGHTRRYVVRLEPGRNAIRAIAFNADNSLQSAPATIDINATFSARAPALYAIVVGIKDYENPRLALTYPVADAQLFAATLEDKAKGLFSSVRVRTLIKPAETTKAAIVAALEQARTEVRPEDLFVFFVASHGTIDDGGYFLITSNVGSTSTARLKQDALTQDALKALIANIPSSKKLVIFDTCNSGQMGDVLQVAIMSRGMSEDTAIKILSRAVGSTVLSASTSVQEALEGYNGHGLLTWVIVEGLKGAADIDKDGFVKTLELADYVDSQVPLIAEQVFKHKQYPVVSPNGQGFPLVRVR